jgi:hypothetical protein
LSEEEKKYSELLQNYLELQVKYQELLEAISEAGLQLQVLARNKKREMNVQNSNSGGANRNGITSREKVD